MKTETDYLVEAIEQLLSRIVVRDTWDKKAVLVAKSALRKANCKKALSHTSIDDGVGMIAFERSQGYNNLKEKDFKSDFSAINKAVQYAYSSNSILRIELLVKSGALIAAEIDRLKNNTP